jgi:hypothetical protein
MSARTIADWHVYLLRDPRDGSARYVGVTCMAPKDRLHRHVSEALKSARLGMVGPKDEWILGLLKDQVRPQVETLEDVTGSRVQAGDRERAWISRFRDAALLNGERKKSAGRKAWGGLIADLRARLARDGIVVAEKHSITVLRRLEKKGEAKPLRDSSAFLRPDVHAAVEALLGATCA